MFMNNFFTHNKAEKDAESLVPHMIWFYKHNIGVGRTEFTRIILFK